MALLKIWRTIRQQGIGGAYNKIKSVAPGYLHGIGQWRLGRCQCCERFTLFVAHQSGSSDLRTCLFCSANGLYELLASEIRSRYERKLSGLDVLELDPRSPLGKLLAGSRSYTRSFYEENCRVQERNGARLEDITSLSFKNDSLDLIVSSEVLEHVPDLRKAFLETERVLRPGGAHVFTVPPRPKTVKRAEIIEGQVKHLESPDYHLDPLNPQGILAFWDIGPDLPEVVPCAGLKVRIVRGPVGDIGRVVWLAEKIT